MSTDKLISEARARIIWGEPSSAVRDFLIANGVSDLVADAKLKEFEVERTREIRKIGVRNVLIGGLLTGAAGLTLYLASPIAAARSGLIKALAVVLLAGLYGIWKLVKGAVYLVRPQSEHKSIPDIVQSDIIE
jgi:hypothetical protein